MDLACLLLLFYGHLGQDLTNEGDTAYTLAAAGPLLSYADLLERSALSYADGLT